MNESINFTPSELIYVFLDGETTGVESTVLLSAMASNSALQEEFHDALRMRTAALRDAQTAVPSASLSQSLFVKAGFGTAETADETIPVVASPGTFFSGLKWLVAPLLSAAAGSLITGVIMFNMYNGKTNSNIPQTNVTTVQTQQTPVNAVAPGVNTLTTTKPHVNRTTAARTMTENVITGREFGNQEIAKNDAGKNSIVIPSNIVVEAHNNEVPNNIVPAQNSGCTGIDEQVSIPQINSVVLQVPSTQYVISQNGEIYSEDRMPIPMIDNNETERKFLVTASGITGLQLYPMRTWKSDWNLPVNNFSIGGMYHVSDKASFGMELGQEMFPMYVQNADGTFGLQPSLFWIGATYRYALNPVLMLGGLQPFGQFIAGGTLSGPIGKAILGMQYQLNSRFSFSVGAEGTGLLYRTGNGWTAAGKIGFDYSMGVSF